MTCRRVELPYTAAIGMDKVRTPTLSAIYGMDFTVDYVIFGLCALCEEAKIDATIVLASIAWSNYTNKLSKNSKQCDQVHKF